MASKKPEITDEEIEALTLSDEFVTRQVAARKLGVTAQTIHNWSIKDGVATDQEDDGPCLYHLGDCAKRLRDGPSDLGDGSAESKILGRANALLATANRHTQQLAEPARAVLEILRNQVQDQQAAAAAREAAHQLALDKKDAEIARLQDKLLSQVEVREKLLSQEHVRTLEAEQAKVLRQREQDTYDRALTREKAKAELFQEGVSFLKTVAPSVFTTMMSKVTKTDMHEPFLAKFISELTPEQIQKMIDEGILDKGQLVQIIEARKRMRASQNEQPKAAEADELAEVEELAKAIQAELDARLAAEVAAEMKKASQAKSTKSPQNGKPAD